MIKKLFSIATIVAFIFILQVQVVSATFDDIDSGHANYDAINYVQEEGIIDGYPDNTCKPDLAINRAEFTKIVIGAMLGYRPDQDPSGYDIYAPIGLSFPDIEAGAWYIPYIRQAVEKNILSGYPDGTFKPADNINFAEAAKIVVNGFEYEYTEDSTIWYKPYVDILAEKKAIPTTVTSFDYIITRGELSEMIYRLKGNITDKASQTYADLEGECDQDCTAPAPDYSAYLEWLLPENAFVEQYSLSPDCAGVMSGWTYGGDLFSSLIADENVRDRVKLDLYTPEYLAHLEKTITDQSHAKWDKDFYAHYVCNLGPSGDIAAGILHPQGDSATEGAGENDLWGNLSPEEMLVVSVHGDEVDFYDNLRTVGNTATGAEPPICSAEGITGGFTWSCFLGLHVVDGGVDGSDMEYTSILFDGSDPVTWQDVELSHY